jgi:predicted DNA-binding transcriptional regulator AlpA
VKLGNTTAAAQRVYTINEFCKAHRLSRSVFYRLVQEGKAPRCFRNGSERRITVEAAKEWVRAREARMSDNPITRGEAESNHERTIRRAGRRLFLTWTIKDLVERTAILREHKRFKKMQKELRRRVERYNKKARRERCAHYAPMLRIKP